MKKDIFYQTLIVNSESIADKESSNNRTKLISIRTTIVPAHNPTSWSPTSSVRSKTPSSLSYWFHCAHNKTRGYNSMCPFNANRIPNKLACDLRFKLCIGQFKVYNMSEELLDGLDDLGRQEDLLENKKSKEAKRRKANAVDSICVPGMTGTSGEKLTVLSCGSLYRPDERYFEFLSQMESLIYRLIIRALRAYPTDSTD
ncbi:hypothetical protein BDC45DRAFT_540226 [Circinella umbellata]|nr:hypothetical protein BDC45DRAFT_540226 [Circinella umbellata]